MLEIRIHINGKVSNTLCKRDYTWPVYGLILVVPGENYAKVLFTSAKLSATMLNSEIPKYLDMPFSANRINFL